MILDETGFEAGSFQENDISSSEKSPSPIAIPENTNKEDRKSVEVNGTTWHYLEHGNPQGINVLNIHGWLGSSAEGNASLAKNLAGESQNSQGLQNLARNNPELEKYFKNKVESLKDKYHVVTPELPGFGVTEPLNNTSLDKIADAVVDFQTKLGMEKPIIFGSSMGGILAAKIASRHPESAKFIVLQGTMTRPADMDKVTYLAMQVATLKPVSYLLGRLGLDKNLFAFIVKGSKDFKLADKNTQEEILSATFKADSKTSVNTLKEIGQDIGEDIKKIQCPVVILDGANGELVPILKSHEATKRFHPSLATEEKIPEKIVFLPIGGKPGEQGHNIINTFPEGVASWIDTLSNHYSQKEADSLQTQTKIQ